MATIPNPNGEAPAYNEFFDLLAKDKPTTGKDGSTPTKRKVVFQSPLKGAGEKENTFNLPEDRSSYLPLTLAADVRSSVDPFSTSLQKPSSNEISQDPDLADANFERRHMSLKAAAWQWANENFPPEKDNGANGATDGTATAAAAKASSSKISDVMQLCQDHPQLAEYVNFLASCPHDETWEHFFNTRKPFLALAVLAKVLEVHVFGQEMFGASAAQVKVLRALDLEMMHQDGKSRGSCCSGSEVSPVFFFLALRSRCTEASH